MVAPPRRGCRLGNKVLPSVKDKLAVPVPIVFPGCSYETDIGGDGIPLGRPKLEQPLGWRLVERVEVGVTGEVVKEELHDLVGSWEACRLVGTVGARAPYHASAAVRVSSVWPPIRQKLISTITHKSCSGRCGRAMKKGSPEHI